MLKTPWDLAVEILRQKNYMDALSNNAFLNCGDELW